MAPGIADRKNNALPLWGNEKTMNMNNLILTNILSSHYFKVNLYQLKTYHQVIDEIYYQVSHLEPWEKGSRKTSGQTGMCGGVRGVGAGGIVSTAFCILYKLFTLKLTRKQVVGLIRHGDSPYIRALGFMYIRYTQPPSDLWDWYESYLDDDEELDVKAGGGHIMTIGELLRHFLSKLEWFSTLFPRIPVPVQKDLEKRLSDWKASTKAQLTQKQEWSDANEAEWSEHQVRENSAKHKSDRVEDKGERIKKRRYEDHHTSSSSSRQHSTDYHRRYEKHGSRGRSRSPSTDVRSHQEMDRHRDGEKRRHRSCEHNEDRRHRRNVSNQEKWTSKDKLADSYRNLDRKAGSSYSHEHVRKHEKYSTHLKDQYRY